MILVFNVGSASLRWALFDENLKEVAGKRLEYPEQSELPSLAKEVLENVVDVEKIGHRVVHGGSEFQKPTLIAGEVIKKLEALSPLAPLHNPPALSVIKICQKIRPEIQNWVCFDTAFFSSLPRFAALYGLPLELSQEYGIRRFGFHGLSHEYVAGKAAEKLGKPLEKLRLITVHLGAGASMAAIKNGEPVDTSMGFTPLEGLMMARRSGDLDPGIILFLKRRGLSPEKIEEILGERSGLLGLSGFSGDTRDLVKEVGKAGLSSGARKSRCQERSDASSHKGGKPSQKTVRAGLALKVYAYKIRKYIGAYAVVLGGLDALVFTGAVGENVPLVRDMATHGLKEVLGDFEILVIPTNEEYQIVRKIIGELGG